MIPRDPETFERLVNLGPITHIFSDLERDVAKAGYRAYYQDRGGIPRVWESLGQSERFRWLIAAQLVCDHDEVMADEIRRRYFTLVDVRDWHNTSRSDRLRWARVAVAMRSTFRRAKAEERMVVLG